MAQTPPTRFPAPLSVPVVPGCNNIIGTPDLSDGLTMLSYGAGQDSTAILYKIIYDSSFREKYIRGHLLVVMSDTGNEHPDTYIHVSYSKKVCEEHGIDFVFLTNDMGYHGNTWPDLLSKYRMNNSIGSKAYPKTCTDNLKLKPIYRYLEEFIGNNAGYPIGQKRAIKGYAEDHGKTRVIIGIAKGEEKRVAKEDAVFPWMRRGIERSYPLIDIGFNRKACQNYMREVGHPVPPPSNCMVCPFLDEVELLWLYRFYPDHYQEWVELEQNKINANLHAGEKNYGVWGRKLLPEVLAISQDKYSDWTDEQLMEYKMSHGHNLNSKY